MNKPVVAMTILVVPAIAMHAHAQSVSVTQSGGFTVVSEAGPTSDWYSLVLDTEPAADVEIVADTDAQADLGFGPGTAVLLTFTRDDWDVPQTITVTAVDDAVVEGAHTATITHLASSDDPDYDGIAIDDVTVNIADNDVAGVTITESGGSTNVNEAGPTADSYTIVLDTRPSASVVITIDPDDQTDVGFGPGAAMPLTISAVTWNLPRTVIVTAVDDAVLEGPHTSTITHSAGSGDPNYNGIAVATVTAYVTDDDTAGVTITESGGSTDVGEVGPTSDTYTVTLNKEPAADVTITVTPDAQTDLGAGAGTGVALSFPLAAWDVTRTVTVTAVDDAVPEGPHTSTIKHEAASADPNYDGLEIDDVVANVTDDDLFGVSIVESGGSTSISEVGPTSDTYTIVLDSQPTGDVDIEVSPDGQADVGAGAGIPSILRFTNADWSVPQTVTVTAVDDAVAEGAHTATLTHAATSSDPRYDGLAIDDVVADMADNDAAGVAITQSGGSTNVSEAGPTSDAYTIVLNSQPTATVTLTVDPDWQTDVGAGPGVSTNLTFTAGNWSTSRTVTVTAVDDDVVEGNHTSTITHVAVSADPNYDGIAISDVTANVADDDTAGATIVASGGSTDVSETGPTSDTYTIVLDSEPVTIVAITVDPDGQTDLGGGAGTAIVLSFDSSNWDAAQTVTVTAEDDALIEGPHTSTITHTAVSADPTYHGIAIGDVVANVTDNDLPGVTITESGGSTDVSETGPTSDSYTVVLDSRPTDAVTIIVDPDPQTDLGAGPGAAVNLSVPPGNWDVPRTVLVTAVDDDVAEGPHVAAITHTAVSADPNYDAMAIDGVTVNVADNDASGVSIVETDGSTDVSEAGPTSDTYSVVLLSEPTAAVTITVDPDGQTDLGGGGGAAILMTFNAGNWDAAQSVTVTAVDDGVPEGPHTSAITHTAASADPGYDEIAIGDVVADVTDNDLPGVTISQSGGSTELNETGPTSDTYTIVLDSLPSADVTITVHPDAQADVGAGPGTALALTISAADWDLPQTVTVTAVDDDVAEGAHTSTIAHTSGSADPDYDGIAIGDVVADVSDNDTAGVIVSESGGSTSVDETGPSSDTYTVVLTSEPTAGVTISVDPDSETDLGAGPGAPINLVFSAGDWDVPQVVAVTAVDDDVDEGPHTSAIIQAAASADPNYDGIAVADVSASISDNDTAGVTVEESGGSTDVDESGPTSDAYTVALESEPTVTVSITVDPDPQSDVGAGPGAAVSLTFTAGNWDSPQTVTATAVDDDVDEDAHSSTITHSAVSADPNYDGIAIVTVAASITDNDTAGVLIAQSDGSTDVAEAGPTSDSYTIALESKPTANVTIAVDPDPQADVGAGMGSSVNLTFTTGNWDWPQTVTVTAVDDDVDEGTHTCAIAHAAVSTDSKYDGIAIVGITANVSDNDVAGVTIVESGGSTEVSETGPTSDTYTVVLDSQPTADVTVTVDPDPQTDLGAGAGVAVGLVFPPPTWDAPRTVTVTAVVDGVPEGPHASTIAHTATSADAKYEGISIGSVVAGVRDRAGVTVIESDGSTQVSESGPTSDAYSIVLNSPPAADVILFVDPDGQLDVGAGPAAAVLLTFSPADWDNAQTITATAVDDAVVEGSHTSSIAHFALSSDAEYHGIGIASVVADVTDNDSAPPPGDENGGSNRGPFAKNQSVVTDEDTAANIILSATGSLVSTSYYSVASGPSNGALTGSPPYLTFTPHPNFAGRDYFRFLVAAGDTAGDIGTVSIEVIPVPDAPVGLPQTVAANAGEVVDVLLFGMDPDEGESISFEIIEPPAHGTLAGVPPNLVYAADSGFDGADAFTYVVSDGARTSEPAVVTIVVSGPAGDDDDDPDGGADDDNDIPNDTPGTLIAEAGEDVQAVVGKTVSFDGSASRIEPAGESASVPVNVEIIGYVWDFDATDGVGVDATAATVEWVYGRPGEYQVTLVVFDTLGRESRDVASCTVIEDTLPAVVDDDPSPNAPRAAARLCGVSGSTTLLLMMTGLIAWRTTRRHRAILGRTS